MNTKHNILLGSLCALGCEALYGLSYIFTKQATASASSFQLLGWRFLIAAIIMSICAVTGLVKIHLKGKNLRPLILVALFCPVIYFIGETFGIQNTTASESGVCLACIPVASMVASTLLLKKRPTKFQIIGVLITLTGVVITVLAVGASSSMSIPGYCFLLVAVVSYALYCVFVEKASDFSGTEITYIMLMSGAVVFGCIAVGEALFCGNLAELAMVPFRQSAFLIAILYQGIGCSILAFFLSNVAIAKIGVNRVSSFIGVSTVVSILAGAGFLHETFTTWQIIGALIIIAGVYTANAGGKE